jgi:hypothetical protein
MTWKGFGSYFLSRSHAPAWERENPLPEGEGGQNAAGGLNGYFICRASIYRFTIYRFTIYRAIVPA